MANELPFNIVMVGTLPAGFAGTPQQIGEAIAARLRLQSTQQFATFTAGATEPSSDQGPWINNGVEWWVWDVDLGRYRPQTINLDGVADASIPQSKLAPGILVNPRPFRASSEGTGQSIAIEASGFGGIVDISMPTENFDPEGAYNPVTSTYQAVEAGWYVSGFFFQINNSSTNPGVSASMQIGIFVADATTNANLGGFVTTNVPSPVGNRWFLSSYDVIQLTAGQVVRLRGYAVDGTGTGDVDVASAGNCYWSMHMLKQIIA